MQGSHPGEGDIFCIPERLKSQHLYSPTRSGAFTGASCLPTWEKSLSMVLFSKCFMKSTPNKQTSQLISFLVFVWKRKARCRRHRQNENCNYKLVIRLQLKCDGTRRRTGGEVIGKRTNGLGSQYSSHYLGTWCTTPDAHTSGCQ